MKAVSVLYHSGKGSLDSAGYGCRSVQHDPQGHGVACSCQHLLCTATNRSDLSSFNDGNYQMIQTLSDFNKATRLDWLVVIVIDYSSNSVILLCKIIYYLLSKL